VQQAREFVAEDGVETLARWPQVVSGQALDGRAVLQEARNSATPLDAAAACCVHGFEIGAAASAENPWRE
jgi:hypothetical protein